VSVRVLLPRLLADCTGGRTSMSLDLPDPSTVRALLDALAAEHPVLDRRVDGEEVRRLAGLATPVPPGGEVMVVQSVAGG
jgi:molybdopterin synthase sulfur carrier subunit